MLSLLLAMMTRPWIMDRGTLAQMTLMRVALGIRAVMAIVSMAHVVIEK
ncbi:MAG: hypothetical protein HQL53_13475 [Magnetococcales bacterium]|nr:hypothetical protein [Magnetococcales bacterium]